MDTQALAFPKRISSLGKHSERLTTAQFRSAVWLRDQGRDRATGALVGKGSDRWQRNGEVAHLKCRRVMPEWKTDPDRAVLLSGLSHWQSDHRGGRLLKIVDAETGEPATDARRKLRFTLYAKDGSVVRTHVS